MTRARRRARRSLCRFGCVRVLWPATADMEKGSADSIETKTRPGRDSAGGGISLKTLEFCFALQQLVDRDPDFGHAAEHRAFLALLHVLEGDAVGGVRQRHVLDLLRQRGPVLHVVLD